jgi:hypothetical protein
METLMSTRVWILAAILFTGCGPKHALTGQWVDSETGSVTKIGGTGAVKSITDSDGEKFEVLEGRKEGDTLIWKYFVPSTGYVVEIRATPNGSGGMDVTWSNDQGASGTEVWGPAR